MAVMDQVLDMQERMLEGVVDAQSRIVDLTGQLVEATGNLPTMDLPANEWMPNMDEALPLDEMVGNYFDFAGKVMDANRSFMEQLVSVWSGDEQATEAAKTAKTAKK